MLGYDDRYFVCMQFKTVPSRRVYNSAHRSEDLNIDCSLKTKSGTGGATSVFINILRVGETDR